MFISSLISPRWYRYDLLSFRLSSSSVPIWELYGAMITQDCHWCRTGLMNVKARCQREKWLSTLLLILCAIVCCKIGKPRQARLYEFLIFLIDILSLLHCLVFHAHRIGTHIINHAMFGVLCLCCFWEFISFSFDSCDTPSFQPILAIQRSSCSETASFGWSSGRFWNQTMSRARSWISRRASQF